MSVDYPAIATKILNGLAKAGVAMTLRRTIQGTYVPGPGTYAGGSTTDYTVTGVIQSSSMPQSGNTGQRFFNGVLVQTDDQTILISALQQDGSQLPITPGPGDLLIVGSDTFTVVTQIPIMPGGTPLLYRLLARK